jgi:GNAT superfamily N-acetyltransferase
MLTFEHFSEQCQVVQDHIVSILWDQWQHKYVTSSVGSTTELCNKLKSAYACLVMFDNGEVVGTVTITIDTPTETFTTQYWIGDLLIKEEFRKKRLGSKAMYQAEKYLKSRGVSIAHLWCEKDVVDFYVKAQWNISPDDVHDGKYTLIKML